MEQVLEHTDEDGSVSVDYYDVYEPLFIHPPPPIINIPRPTPVDVFEQLTLSFQLYWSDPESCANRLRAAIEKLLNYYEVRRFSAPKKGRKRVALTLHNRIQIFATRDKPMSDHLMAVKWLGNARSHAAPIVREDLLDGFEILEYVLEEMFSGRSKKVAKLSNAINRTKRPRSSKSGSKSRTRLV